MYNCAVCDKYDDDDNAYYAVGVMMCEECGQKYEAAFHAAKHEFNERYVQDARNAVNNERDARMIDDMLSEVFDYFEEASAAYPDGYNEHGFKVGEF